MRTFISAIALIALASPACAHFQEILPSEDVLPDGGKVTVDLIFTHPMERGPTMDMARPVRVGVAREKGVEDISGSLVEAPVDGKQAWRLERDIAEPGAEVFFVEPKPYWEPAENKYIVHYAKVVVDGYASGEGWDRLVGLPVEIAPLVRPTGLWTGNLFRAVVLKDGQPVPGAEIEVEWVNDGTVTPPNEAFITQVIKADDMGVFSYAMPRAGWWGFAALIDGPETQSPDGKPASTELGALMWVKTTDMGGAR
ncbi:MAG: ATP-dependent ligase [Proteobacteria bacterium]|nr:ATP-dependent ligase [Pseudomonadota bacterium]